MLNISGNGSLTTNGGTVRVKKITTPNLTPSGLNQLLYGSGGLVAGFGAVYNTETSLTATDSLAFTFGPERNFLLEPGSFSGEQNLITQATNVELSLPSSTTGSVRFNNDVMTVDEDGTVDITGTYTVGPVAALAPGSIVKSTLFNTADLGIPRIDTASTTFIDIHTINYTPLTSGGTSKILIIYDISYIVSSFGDAYTFETQITVDGTPIGLKRQIAGSTNGSGCRSSTILPIVAVYSNTGNTPIQIKLQLRQVLILVNTFISIFGDEMASLTIQEIEA